MRRESSGNMLLDIAGLIGSRFMLVVFGFGTGIITARILGPHDRGLFTLLISSRIGVRSFTSAPGVLA